MKANPGKFEGTGNYDLVARYLHAVSLEGWLDDEFGEVDSFGWYGYFAGKIKGRGPFYAILSEDSVGFFDVTWFNTQEDLDAEWLQIQAEYEEYQGPQDDDLTTPDHINFYQYGKLVLTVEDDEDYEAVLKKYMIDVGWFPNVWFISDHGNAHLLNLD